ncbi:MAG: HEAT repeat domain-containing protein [Verrucomicrobiota bacterium]
MADSDKTVSDSAQNALIDLTNAPNGVAKPEDFAPRLADPNPRVVMFAALCLAMLKDNRAVPVLLKLVASDDQTVRLDAVKGLGESGDPSVLPTLRQTLKDSDLNMRGWSIIGLGNLKDEDSLLDLEGIASDDTQPSTIRAAAAAAVEKIKRSLPPVDTTSP